MLVLKKGDFAAQAAGASVAGMWRKRRLLRKKAQLSAFVASLNAIVITANVAAMGGFVVHNADARTASTLHDLYEIN